MFCILCLAAAPACPAAARIGSFMAVSDTAWTVKLWEDALKQVERLPAGSPRAGSSQQHAAGAPSPPVDDVLPTVDEFLELPDLQPALWTKLTAVMKV